MSMAKGAEAAFRRGLEDAANLKQVLAADDHLMATCLEVADAIVAAFRAGGRLWLCGNGGSAADAQHLAAELSGRYYRDRAPLPAEALHVNASYMTAVANDYSYHEVYARLLLGFARPGDVLIGLSTSGNSLNVVNAFKAAREMEVKTVAMTGAGGGALALAADWVISIPSSDTPRVQEAHMLLGHLICEVIEGELFP